jgi:polyhydroxyalkanoate synthesis regulator phasin
MSLIRKTFYMGLGALTLTKEKAERLIKEMEEKGEMSREEGKEFLDEVIKKGEEQKNEIRSMISDNLKDLKSDFCGVSQADYQALEERVRKLEEKLAEKHE